MTIRVLTFEGCPHGKAADDLVKETVRDLHLPAVIEAIRVNSEDEAKRYNFLGSPTIQVDGRDVEVGRRTDTATFSCRVYRTPNGLSGVPPRELLVDAIREAERGSH